MKHAAGRVVSPVLIGRAAELERLVAAAVAAPSVTVVEGEAGIGKSRLVAELAARPELAGRRLLKGGCGQVREPFPLGPIVEALRGRAADLKDATLSPVAGSLRALLPELGAVLPEPLPPLEDRAAERHRLFRGLADVLAALGPAVLVVEDLHWGDEQTVEFLGYLVGALPDALSVVLTYRGEEADAALRAVTARPPDPVGREHLVLRPLDVAATQALASAILDAEEVSAEFATHLCARSSGLPLAIQELLALLRSRGVLIRWEGGWARRALDELDVPAGVLASVQERVAGLPDRARAVIQAAAVLQLAVPAALLAEVAGLPDLEGLDAALDSGLLTERDGMVGFRHVLAAQAVYEGLPLGRRRSLHAGAAQAVRALRPVPLGQVAHHLRHAGRPAEWVAAAVTAAEHATTLGNDAEAARLLENLLRHADLEPVRRAELTIRLGWVALNVLRVPAIGELLAEAIHQDLPRRVRGELRLLLGLNIDVTRVDQLRIRQVFVDAVDDLEELPEYAAWAMVGLGVPTITDRPLDERMAWLERALDTLPADGDKGTRLLVLGKIAMVFAVVGDPRWSELTDRIVKETGGRPVGRQETVAYKSIGGTAMLTGHHRTALSLLEAALDSGRSSRASRADEFRLRLDVAMVRYLSGSWDALAQEIATLRDEYARRPAERIQLSSVAACLAAAPGRLGTAHDQLLDVIHEAHARGDGDILPLPVTMLLRLAAARGAAEPALAETAGAVTTWEAKDLWPVGVRAVPALAEAMLAAGRPDEAAELADRYEARLRGLDAPLAEPALAHARGLIDLAAGQWARAAGRFAAAAAAYGLVPAAYEEAQATEHAAACLFELGDPAAESTLERAITAYTRLDARWDLDRATRLGRRWGLRPVARVRPAESGEEHLTGLSARQVQVARLAAAGLTNQEIARQMFLSPKTVDKHLGMAMRKLGARSRTELAHHLTDRLADRTDT
ncbi:helix-turn-helix transcriptional regulator [Nonomuraea zeae]|uniref:LuxR family transcriptional regulator n=1 Tax=Nonomuraea zeae TaxID=1642303 RepID=A0A5S4GE00_9ACTN|nr:LuxR family transcriptional regulator [Nonomuraea zeae]TMR31223.1 LuxR family transcriptional regulator [Nonomuraea zeae]